MKIGVIGTGKMGENHVRTYLSLDDHCQFVGIYDNDFSKAQEIAKKYNVTPFRSIEKLLLAVDAVSIAVPTEFHYKIGLTCIDYKVHIMMEKPITTNVEQADDLIHKARQAGVKLQVGHIELFNPLIQYLLKELESANIIGASFHRLSPYDDDRMKQVDVVSDLMIHDLYILNRLLKDNMTTFYAFGKVMDQTIKHAAVLIKSTQGVIAQLTASFKSKRKQRNIQILTEDAFIVADILANEITITHFTVENTNDIPVPVTKTIQFDDKMQPLRVQLMDFINCIKYDTQPTVSGTDGMEALKITNKISETIKNNNSKD